VSGLTGPPGGKDTNGVTSDKARKLFEALDLDGNGTLTREEVITALRTKGPSLVATGVLPPWGVGDADDSSALFDTADQNGDTVLTLEEFAAVVDRRFGWH
jgi:Ca2+-binding EF-hand superfamily protein